MPGVGEGGYLSPGCWGLKQHTGNPDEPILVNLREIARLHAEIPRKRIVLRQMGSWETAAWDVEVSRYINQLWRMGTHCHSGMRQQDQERHPEVVPPLLDFEGCHRYALPSTGMRLAPPRLLIHRQHQQDALQHTWTGLVAGTDGSIDERTEQDTC
jgi:hypothetical protein